MKNLFYLLIASLILILPGTKVLAQDDDDCCEEYYDGGTLVEPGDDAYTKEMNEYTNKKAALLAEIDLLNKEIEDLKAKSSDKDKALSKAEEDYYKLIGAKKSDVDAFRTKFSDCEKMIQNCKNAESAEKIYKNCFTEIEASKIKCLTEFWERYLLMKKKLEECALVKEKVVEKSGNYTVVKGDCLWKIAGKKEIYGNSRLWAKIWEANKSGVVSAPPRVTKTIKNPNLIYPGQVLRIPVLSDAEKKMQSNKVNEVKKKKKNKRGSGEKGTDVKKEVKKETKKEVKKSNKKITKKHK